MGDARIEMSFGSTSGLSVLRARYAHRSQFVMLPIVAAVLAFWLPSTAGAASVDANYFRDEGEVNSVTMARIGNSYQITDTMAILSPTDPCTVDATGHVATCPAAVDSTTSQPFVFYLGGQDDWFLNQDPLAYGTSVFGEDGDDTLTGGAGTENLWGGSGYDVLAGGDGNDGLTDGPGDDFVDGGSGNDYLFSDDEDEDAADDFVGGLGDDTVNYSTRVVPVDVTLDDQPNDGEPGEIDFVAPDVENVTGGQADDRVVGNDAANRLGGGVGNDTIAGAGGADGLGGNAGNDVMDGGPGFDFVLGGDGDDQIAVRDGEHDSVGCGAGTDSVVADYDDGLTPDCELVDRSPAPPTPPPAPPWDTTAPVLRLSGALSQRVLRERGVFVVASSPAEASTVLAKGRVVIRGSAKAFKLIRATRQIAMGGKATLKLRLKRKALKSIGRALRAGKKVTAKVTVDATDAADNLTVRRRTIKLRR